MPKIGNESLLINGKFINIEINYSRKLQFYARGIPEEVLHVSEIETITADTEKQLLINLHQAINLYHDKIKSSKKVIAYTIYAAAETVMNRTGVGRLEGHKPGVPKGFDHLPLGCDGSGFTIEWEILMEVKAKTIEYYPLNDGVISSYKKHINPNKKIIDWTPQREQAFKNIDLALERMVINLMNKLADTKTLLYNIDNNIKLLME